VTLDGRNRTDFVPYAYVGYPHAIAIDWIGRNIYWSNPARFTIEVSGVRRGHVVLDIAGGTGDLAARFSRGQ